MPTLDYHAPAEPLRDYVSLYYFFDCPEAVFADIERAAVAQMRFILLGDSEMHFFDGRTAPVSGAALIGPTTGHSHFAIKGPFKLFGMGLLPAGWGAITSRSAAEIVDQVIPATQFFPNIGQHLEALRTCSNLAEMAERADIVLTRLVAASSPDILTFTNMVDGWLAAAPSPCVQQLREMSGLSARQLARKVKHYYGMSPKYLSRKYRALRAARALVDATGDDADYLRDAFYDQSHMIRELKIFSGMTPSQLQHREGLVAQMIDKRIRYDGEISALTSRT